MYHNESFYNVPSELSCVAWCNILGFFKGIFGNLQKKNNSIENVFIEGLNPKLSKICNAENYMYNTDLKY